MIGVDIVSVLAAVKEALNDRVTLSFGYNLVKIADKYEGKEG